MAREGANENHFPVLCSAICLRKCSPYRIIIRRFFRQGGDYTILHPGACVNGQSEMGLHSTYTAIEGNESGKVDRQLRSRERSSFANLANKQFFANNQGDIVWVAAVGSRNFSHINEEFEIPLRHLYVRVLAFRQECRKQVSREIFITHFS